MTDEPDETRGVEQKQVKPFVTARGAGKVGWDFLTGCVALVIIGVVVFLLVPLMVLLFKLSLLIAIPIGLFLLLLVFTTLFGRIINILRKL